MRNKIVKMLMVLMTGGVLLTGCTSSGQGEQQSSESTSVTEESEDASSEEITESTEDKKTETEAEIVCLRDSVGETMNCFVGCAITGAEADDPKVMEILTTHFNAVTLGNELKPDCIFNYSNSMVPGIETAELNGETIEVPKTYFGRAEKILDKILAWNEEHPDREIKVRGHVLVWHSQTPEWFFHEDYDKNKPYVDKETMTKRQEWYIRTVLTHFTGEDSKYKDLFYGWDVVNEAVSDGGGYRTDNENPNENLSNDTHGNNSSWYHIYGNNEYIINAFIFANKYAPQDLELYYNDYNECSLQKRTTICELLTELKEKEGAPGEGTRISAMGMQGHYGMESPTTTEFKVAMQFYGEIVGNVQITEMDLKASDTYTGTDESKAEEYEKQKQRYNLLYFEMKNTNKLDNVKVSGITFWGTVDHYSWLQTTSNVGGGNTSGLKQCPLLFDEHYEPKPCFYVFSYVPKK